MLKTQIMPFKYLPIYTAYLVREHNNKAMESGIKLIFLQGRRVKKSNHNKITCRAK